MLTCWPTQYLLVLLSFTYFSAVQNCQKSLSKFALINFPCFKPLLNNFPQSIKNSFKYNLALLFLIFNTLNRIAL